MKNRIILKIRAGSHLYGLNTPESDEDYLGVYLSTPDELLGLQASEIVDESVVSKQENGRNDKDAVDCKYYELRRFCNLALSANPTILELLFAGEENILICDEYGRKLIQNRDKFLSTRINHTYLGYAHSQMAKSQVKSDNLRILIKARELLLKENQQEMLYTAVLYDDPKAGGKYPKLQYSKIIKRDENFPDYLGIADTKFNNQKIKDVIKKLNDRLDKATNRADGMLKNGLDFKFVSHTMRLIKEGEELLKTGTLKFPLKDRELLMDIKLGRIEPSKVLDMIGDIEKLKEDWRAYTDLPRSSDFKSVNKMIIEMYTEYLKGEFEWK
jgi:predicted nucleotidyltransferase